MPRIACHEPADSAFAGLVEPGALRAGLMMQAATCSVDV
jgi:hypothetical protein